ncbi:unnamed protein product, partial [Effrenium voratum]
MGRGPAALAYASMGLAVAAVAIAAGCAAQFTAMPALFLGHIAAMCACWCLMTAGSVVYSMAGFWPATGKNKDAARKAHAAIQSTAVLAALVGYLCIFSNHRLVGGSQFGFDPGNPPAKTAHALLGYVVLALMLLQAVQGWQKFLGLQVGKIRHLAHPLNGRATLIIAAINMALVLTTFPFLSQALFLTLAGGIPVISVLATVLAGPL